MRWRVKVPGTSANLGPGFDSLGLALDLWNEVELTVGAVAPEILIYGEGASELPADRTHLVWRVMADYCLARGLTPPLLRLTFLNRLPLARGLGSSASARVMGLALGQILVRGELAPPELIELATDLEGHPDNVAPAVLGGLVASLQGEFGVMACPRPLHRDWKLVVAIPQFHLETELSRRVLPATVSHKDAIYNVVRMPVLMAALEEGRADWLREASRDVLHQPYRVELVPGLGQVFQAAENAGAAAVYLSGAGPTVAAWVGRDEEVVARVSQAMTTAFLAVGVEARTLTLAVSAQGAQAQRLD